MEFGDRPGPGAGGETVAKTGLLQKPHGRGGERGRVVNRHRQAGLVMAAHPGHPAMRNRGVDHRAAARHGLDLHQPISLATCFEGNQNASAAR